MISRYSNRGCVLVILHGRPHHGNAVVIFLKVPNRASASVYNSYDIKLNAALLIMAHIVPARP